MIHHRIRHEAPGFTKAIAYVLLAVGILLQVRLQAQTPAFPGAEGAGKHVTGGRGTVGTATTVFEVTSLADNNVAGTLRYACSQSATYRTIVFRVSGTIHINSPLSIPANTTLAGQTAPGDGICLADYWVTIGGNNVIIRYVRFRMGDKNQLITNSSDTNCQPIWPPFTESCKPLADVSGSYDSLGATDKNNLMVDHCSVSWCDDEALSLKNCANTTVQWTIVSEPLDYSYHYEGVETNYQQHGYGGIMGATNASFHHNLYAHCKSRCPRFHDTPAGGTKIRVDMRNNVIYNWRINTAYGGIDGEFNLVSNYYKAGPNTTTDLRIVGTETTARYYLMGNKMVGHDGENGTLSVQVTTNNWYGTSSGAGSEATLSMASPTLTNIALTTQHTAQAAYDIVLAQAGANLPKRDSVDARIVNDVKNKTGSIIDVQGGYPHGTPYNISSNAWPVLLSTTPPTDTDHDGMPDFWETAYGLNPSSSTDRNNRNAEGYTMLEVYLNSLTVPPLVPANLVATPGNTVVTLTWSLSLTATNYIVKRSINNGGPYSNLTTLATTNCTDTLVTNGTTYFYVVSAISAAGESTNSAQVSATPQGVATPPDTPLNLVATAGNASVALTWSSAATATNYNVKRSTTNGGSYTIIAGVPNPNHTDKQVTNGTTYFYVVSAVNANGESTNSTQVSATPQAMTSILVTSNVLTDTFGSSSLNSLSPAAPTATNTSYSVMSSKSWSPSPSRSTGHLKFGIGVTTSGSIEVQALFASVPMTLATVGDSLSLVVTFTNTSGLLTQASAMGFGLYNSGQNFPVPGGLNSTATTAYTTHTSGNAKPWAGYVGQLGLTGANSQIMTRPTQTFVTLSNNCQDVVTSGSGSSSYSYPAGATVGTALSAPSLTLLAGKPYTAVLTITLSAPNTLAITNFLYDGTDTNGALLSQFGGGTSGSTYLTNAFDALAVGWRATANTSATTIDINQITVKATYTIAATNPPTPPPAPDNLTATPTNLLINLKWNAVTGATNYYLKRGTVSGGPYSTTVSLAVTNYADAAVTNAVNYFYVVSAVGAGGESTDSLPVSAVPLPSNQPASLAIQVTGSQLQLSWPMDHLGWRVQIQTNNVSAGIGTDWQLVPGSDLTNRIFLPVSPANGSVFLRLIYP